MARLSSAIRDIKDHYAVVVVGSGYGGAIAASRLARAGQQVCILERGREIQPGEYPNTDQEAIAEMQAELPSGHTGSRAGLYDFYVNPDVNVFVGCGLGGTSLINANLALKPEPRVFQDPGWPQALRNDVSGLLEESYQRSQEMLKPVPYPTQFPALPKLEALEQSAAHLGQACDRAPITVSFTSGVNHVGVEQQPCMLCGDCVTGCNYGAKNTVLFNYLPDARNFGTEIYTQVSVRHIAREGSRWVVYYQVLDTGLEPFDAPTRSVSADIVVLAAGTLGSTEILLRSKAAGLSLSDRVGDHFSGNGDVLGYSYGCAREIRSVGYGPRDPREMEAVGPCVTGLIDMREQPELNQGILIQEFSTPGALSGLLPLALAKTASALGRYNAEGLEEALAMDEMEVESLFLGPYTANAQDTQAYLVTTHEGGAGRMRLQDDRLKLEWPHVGSQPIFERVNQVLAEATKPLGGSYLINPVWSTLLNRDLITVHPLGGCVMAEDAAQGVVNHKGQVFSESAGTNAYADLYVRDGSIIPRSLGVSPLLTISALSERACALMAQDRGWHIDYALPSRPAEAAPAAALGVRFAETMHGDGFEIEWLVVSDNLHEMMSNPDHLAHVCGQVIARALSSQPLTVTAGEFNLARMTYHFTLASREGQKFRCRAVKDGASLHLTVLEGAGDSGKVGVTANLRALPQDLAHQLATLSITGAESPEERLEATERFGNALAGELYAVYGSVAGGRKKRPLHVNPPAVYSLSGNGVARPRLLRYEGGSHGPVLLNAGRGISSLVFSIDTIETNLVEFLFARGFDVWLLDSMGGESEAAVNRVKELTGAGNVQVIAPAGETGEPVELTVGTQEALHEIFGGALSLVGKNAARDYYPRILNELESSAPPSRAKAKSLK